MFYKHHGGVYGPTTRDDVALKIRTGALPADTPISETGDGPWAPADYRLGLNVAAPAAAPARRKFGWLAFLAIAAVALWGWSLATARSFSDASIETIKAQIRVEFAKRDGVNVDEIMLVRKSDRELTGFAKLSVGRLTITKDCLATMGTDGQTFWKCQ